MRIAFFTETFLPKVDGIVNTLCHLLDHMDKRGHETLLFAPKGGPTTYARTRVIGLDAFPFPFYPEFRLVPPIHIGVGRDLAHFQPDLVHLLNPVSLGLTGMQAARAMHLPVAASYHTDIPGYADLWGLGFSRDFLWNFFRWIHNQADLNLCPSKATLAELQQHGFHRVKVWGRGVDTQLFHPCRRSLEWRRRLSGGEIERPLLLYVGRLSVEKRVDWLAPVMAALPGARLAIVGDGPLRGALEEQFAPYPVVFTGYLSGTDLAQAYASADVFTFPAANETCGNVILEAMASGLPVIAPGSGGVTDHILDGETGFLFPSEEEQALVEAARLLVQQPELALGMGIRGRQHVENQSWDVILDQLVADYQGLIQSNTIRPGQRKSPAHTAGSADFFSPRAE
ncbi:MAG: glycosyltransferase family 1 protein [Chloroflexi bacterium]|nr:glycosyltransferase family 1 protein [Anaerolineaceae bacterium]NMB87511.1 glycosyltransferase family 1 protein [Chloroflexota bacterium]